MSDEQYRFLFKVAEKYLFHPDSRELDKEYGKLFEKIKAQCADEGTRREILDVMIVYINTVHALEVERRK